MLIKSLAKRSGVTQDVVNIVKRMSSRRIAIDVSGGGDRKTQSMCVVPSSDRGHKDFKTFSHGASLEESEPSPRQLPDVSPAPPSTDMRPRHMTSPVRSHTRDLPRRPVGKSAFF